jgi:[NiFe] hydrogenase diaphorase moiety small subunit
MTLPNSNGHGVCPVGVISRKRRGFATPIGERKYDAHPISELAVRQSEER